MKKIAIFAAVVALGTAAASAQNYMGMLPYVSDFWMSRMHTLGGQSAGLGTTRSAAMGGAFTSLGADLSSMHINPAGLGMYKSSEIGISFGPSVSQTTNTMNGMPAQKSSRTAFALNNFGAAFNLFEGSGNLTSFTLGVGYQRLADYNYRSNLTFSGAKTFDGFDSSYLDMLKNQLEGYVGRIGYQNWFDGEVGADFGTGSQAARYNEWGASLAYYTKMLRPGAAQGEFSLGDVLGGNTRVTKNMSTVSKGSQGEYAFAGGWNLSNKFYFGFTLGVVSIYQDRTVAYHEDYADNNASDPLSGMTYEQRVRTSGAGFNAKMGFVWRPDPSLRIGAAFHTPTVTSVSDTYNSSMTAHFGDGDNWYVTPEAVFKNKFYTPARLMAGVSYTVAGRAILAVDYEYGAADGMGVYGSDLYDQNMIDTYRAAVKKYFTGSNTVRAGLEVMAGDMLFLRAGYAWSGQGVRAEAHDPAAINAGKIEAFDSPTTYENNIASVGFGVKIGANTSFDMTYSLGNYKYTDYDAYFYNQHNNPSVWGDGGPHYFGNSAGDMTRQRLTRHNIMLGLNFRF